MTTRTRAAGLLTALTMTVLLAACSSSDSAGDSGADSGSSSFDNGSGGGSAGDTGSMLAEAPSAASRDAAGNDDTSSSSGPAGTPQMERSVISSGTVSLTSTDVAETAARTCSASSTRRAVT